VEMCNNYLNKRATLSVWDNYAHQKTIANRLYAIKAMYYKQKRILLCCPQRKKHPKVDVPGLGNLISPQNVRLDVATCYGLGYCESRQFFVDKALKENVNTHLFFVDDDILLPLDAISKLIDSNEDFISGNYVKRNPNLESIASRLEPSEKLVWQQTMVEPKQGDYRIIDVNCTGLGCALIDLDVFRKIPSPHFQFVWEKDSNGNRTRLLIGEDSNFCASAMLHGIMPKIIPGLVPVHVDFKTGKHYGPEWLVDPVTRTIRPEYIEKYCKFMVDPKELAAKDNDDTFSFNAVQ